MQAGQYTGFGYIVVGRDTVFFKWILPQNRFEIGIGLSLDQWQQQLEYAPRQPDHKFLLADMTID